jgi:multiple antibiotic resistance protein
MSKFWLCFVPLFVAFDAIGLLPTFIALTEGLEKKIIWRIIVQSVITAAAAALVFLAIGNVILKMIGVTLDDFMIAGGVLLFVISLNDMLGPDKKNGDIDTESLGAVPLGVPLMVGPAVLTTTFLLSGQYGFAPTVTAVVLNVLIAGGVFLLSMPIYKFLGKPGAKTISKLANLLLAAIAVMIIRKGVIGILISNGIR